jgi:hypothetical protein
MATEVLISNTDARAKIRNPWGVLGLTLITLGIYTIFWWYFINREMRDLGRARSVSGLGDNPGLSTAAYALGGIVVIPVIWTIVTTTSRAHKAQIAQGQEPFSGWLAAVVYILTLGIGLTVFLQYQMNDVWRNEPVAPPPGQQTVARGDSDLDRIKKLSELRDSGAISQEEFEAEKARVLPPPGSSESG